MRLPALRRSRSTLALLAVAWLPYMLMCCVVAPAAGPASASQPHCHVLADMLPAQGRVDGSSSATAPHHAHHRSVAAHDGTQRMPRSGMPVRTCCDLTGKRHVTMAKAVQVPAPTAIVATVVAAVEAPVTSWHRRVRILLDHHGQDPPLYLRHASFLL
jgi:hypothetical protein